MSKKAIWIRIGIISLGLLDIATGVLLIPFLLLWGYIAFIVGCLYLIFGIALIANRLFSKLLFYGIVPFTILHSVILIAISRDQAPSNYNRMTLEDLVVWILPLLIVCVLNVFFLTRGKVGNQL